MSKVVGDIAVELSADIAPLQRALSRGTKSLNSFGDKAGAVGVRFAKMGATVAAVSVAAGAAVISMARSASATAKEISDLSVIAGTSAEEFQKLAVAANEFGIGQQKLADIFKDVNDKFGDFMATGAGPLADFFENIAPVVGVTAEQFARLSGPEALQLYVTSLERANISQQQMTFYMEALASDATALLPLLRDNGAAMRQFGDEAQAAGRIMSNEMIAKGVEVDRKFRELSETIGTKAKTAILEYSDEIIALGEWVANVGIPALVSFGSAFGDFIESISPAIEALQRFMSLANAAAGVEIGSAAPNATELANDAEDAAWSNGDRSNGDPSSTGMFYVDENGNVQEYGAAPKIPGITVPEVKPVNNGSVPLVRPKTGSSGSSGGGGGGGSSSPEFERADLEALQQRYMEEAELIAEQREEALEQLREYREAKLGTEEEYNELEKRIKEEHEERLSQLERQAQQARLQAMAGALGDLSSLMTTENKKLFKIGQAAAIAEATVSGYSAAVAAWEKGMKIGGPGMAAAFTAASLARTGALISQIASQSPMGGGGSGGGGGGGGGATSQQATPTQTVAINLQGDTFSRASVEGLLEQIQSELDRGGRLVFE